MGNINIISEKIYGLYKYSNDIVNVSGNYLKNGIDNTIQNISGVCYYVNDDNVFYGSFNGNLSEDGENDGKYSIYETKPEYKEAIENVIEDIKTLLS